MRKLFDRIWNAEPVVFVGALSATWAAVVALDQAAEAWEIPVWLYIAAVVVTVFLTAVTRTAVKPVGGTDGEAS